PLRLLVGEIRWLNAAGNITKWRQNLILVRNFASEEALHEEREMLPGNAAILCGFCDDAFRFVKLRSEIDFCELFNCMFLRIHVGKRGERVIWNVAGFIRSLR